jgi:hypothetical protein
VVTPSSPATSSAWAASFYKNIIVFNILQQVAMRFWLWSVLLLLLPSLIHSGHSIITSNIFSLGSILLKMSLFLICCSKWPFLAVVCALGAIAQSDPQWSQHHHQQHTQLGQNLIKKFDCFSYFAGNGHEVLAVVCTAGAVAQPDPQWSQHHHPHQLHFSLGSIVLK